MDPTKVAAIAKYPVPTLVKEIQCFMGEANYYNKFMQNFTQIATLIMHFLKGIHFK